VYELLTLTPALAGLITPQVETAALHLAAQKAGMRPLAIGGALKVIAGQTTVEEVLSAISARG
jgi:general secretion pathway protein E